MTNIGIVTTWFERGAGYVSKAYKQALEKQHNVFIYARGGEKYAIGEPDWDIQGVTWSPWFRRSDISMLSISRWLEKNKIDLVLFNEQQIIEPVISVKELGYKVGAYVDYYKEETLTDFNIYDFLICNTKRHYSVFKNHPNAVYIPWGTDTALFMPVSLERLVDKDEVTFFHSAGMGGLNLRKGTDLLVKAFRQTKQPSKLIIHSQAPLTNYGDEISREIQSDNRIQFIHKTVPAPGLYHLGDVYVYPSRLEGIGLTICEALSVGLPVITTDCAPMNEFIKEGYNGTLIEIDRQMKREDNYYWPESYIRVEHLTQILEWYAVNKQNVIEQKANARHYAITDRCWEKNTAELDLFLSKQLFNPSEKKPADKKQKLLWSIELIKLHLQTLLKFKKIDFRCLLK